MFSYKRGHTEGITADSCVMEQLRSKRVSQVNIAMIHLHETSTKLGKTNITNLLKYVLTLLYMASKNYIFYMGGG